MWFPFLRNIVGVRLLFTDIWNFLRYKVIDSTSKHQETEDRISSLPTDLITHILSLLPTKDAVRTSTLATTWNKKWTSITRLDFDDAVLFSTTKQSLTTQTMFVNFVYRVLNSLEVARLDSFRLQSYEFNDEGYGDSHISAWVSSALSLGVQQLDISLFRIGPNFPPCSLFTNKTLVVLNLAAPFELRVPTTLSLKSLKILRLIDVEFLDDDSLSRFISSCPMLEELKLHGFRGVNVKVISIISLGLKRLSLMDLGCCDEGTHYSYEIVLNTPKLQYFDYEDYTFADKFSIASMDHLVRARIESVEYDSPYLSVDSKALTDLFAGISNVRNLCLSLTTIDEKVPVTINCTLPIFPCLTYLKTYVGSLLINFLQSSPHLQILVLDGNLVFCDYHLGNPVKWCPPTSIPSCMLVHLKVIEVLSFRGWDEELQMLSYFLGKSHVLKELRITYLYLGEKHEASVKKKLLALPKASRSCKIVFCGRYVYESGIYLS